MLIKNAIKYFKTITIHRWHVFWACFRAGITWQGLIHDLSKYSPIEFFNNVKYYEEGRSPIDGAKEKIGYSIAWQHHRGHNPHHYEYWIDKLDNGGEPLVMPYKYAVEMICDYIGAGKAYGKEKWTNESPLNYWVKVKRPAAKIHPIVRTFIDIVFTDISKMGLDVINEEYLHQMWAQSNWIYVIVHKDDTEDKE